MQKALLLLLVFGLLCVQAFSWFGKGIQRVRVKGQLRCGSAPAVGVVVKLVDIDTGGADDLMAETKTAANGAFTLDGQADETTTIDPVLKIYHDCDDTLTPGQRRWKMDIPKKYIGKSSPPPPEMDIGLFNLELRMHDEERNFI